MIHFNNLRNSTLIWGIIFTTFLFTGQIFAQTRIMPLGDSITRGVDGSTNGAGFRNDLADSLNAEGENFVFVGSITTDAGGNHEGHDGKRADYILANINSYLGVNPDIVLLHIGTNDISQDQTPTSTKTEIEGIIDAILTYNSNIKIILSSLIPRNDGDGGIKDDNTTILNNLLVGLYLEKRDAGYKIYYAGNNEVFKCKSNWKTAYLFDHVHPNDTGYAVMAGVWFNVIMNAIYNSDTKITDSFKRQNLGIVWESDPDNKIQNDELINDSIVEEWEYLSIYKGITNPSKASMKWSTTSDFDGIEGSGLALRLDASDIANANGYAVTVRRSRQKLRLWRIEQGGIRTGFIDEYDYSLGGFPDPNPGQVLEVAMASDGSGNSFEVSINGQVYRTLKDTNPPAGNGNDQYAGIILFGNRNNNIAEFSAEGGGDFDPPSQVQDLTVQSVSATSATLTWTAPGGDGNQGTASSYDLRYSTTNITNENDFNAATQVTGLPNPKQAGSAEEFIITVLLPGTTYYFALRAQDSAGNNSLISSPVPSATTDAGQLVLDDFNRTDLGTKWTADGYIQIVGNELSNTLAVAGGKWNIAIYNDKSNPISVAFDWGAGADASGIDQGGMALMMDAADTTAKGYLITRRTAVNEYRLWTISNGQDLAKIKIATPTLGVPKAGQEFRVEISTDGGINTFKVYLGGKLDVTLTDENLFIDPNNVPVQYAGVMLSGGQNNNVDNFKLLLSPNRLDKIVETDNQTGTVGKALPLPIKVKLSDGSLNPVAGENIVFEITSPSGEGTLSDPSGNIVKEAENATFRSPMTTGSDPLASDGTYIWVPEGSGTGNQRGKATITFTITQAGNYYMWGRSIYPDGNSDAFKIQIDGGTEYQWDVEKDRTSSVWKWAIVSHRGSGTRSNPEVPKVLFTFAAGKHTLVVREGKDGTKLDQILFTTDVNYIPSGILSVGGQQITIVTDANGEASANWTLGTIAGIDNNTASATFAGLSVDFTSSANADVPAIVTKFNEAQSTAPGTQLPSPLIVELKDQYGNLVTNQETNWFIANNTNGLLGTPNPIITDITGRAQNTLTTASDSSITRVQVLAPDSTGPEATFVIYAEPGNPAVIQKYAQDSGDSQTGTASKPLSKPFKVFVTDAVGIPIQGQDVTFTRISGGGNFSGNPSIVVQTDAQGIAAATLTLGQAPGTTNTANATATYLGNALAGSPISFTATSAVPQNIDSISSLTQSGTVNLPLGDSIKVRVRDALNQPLPNFSVDFAVTKGDGKVNGATNIPVLTDQNGIATVEWRLGPVKGQNNNELRASAKYNANDITGSPVIFTASAAVGAAANLVKISGDSLSGPIDSALPAPYIVQVTDASNNPIAGWPVTYRVEAGGGSINGKVEDTIPTDINGFSSATLVLGKTAGTPSNPYNNRVKVTSVNNGDLNGSPMYFVASAVATDASILVFTGGSGQSGQAGLPLAQQIKFKVTDNQQIPNPIPNHLVTFKVATGGGTINGTAPSDTMKVIQTDVHGEVLVTWYLGGALGTNSQSLRVSADDGINQLTGSPKTVLASAIAGPVDPNVSFLVSDKTQLPADGQSKATITVTFTDKFGNPVSGKAVTIKASGSNNSIDQPSNPTDNNGQAVGTIYSTRAETKTISARNVLDGFDIQNTIQIIFNSIAANRIEPYKGNNQSANVGTILDDPVEVIVKDLNNNPVQGVDVDFVVTAGNGFVMNSTSLPQKTLGKLTQVTSTDANGVAKTAWVLGPNAGENKLEARVNGLIGSPVVFKATGKSATPTTMAYFSGDHQAGIAAGRDLPSALEILVTDGNSKPVWNAAVTFNAKLGGGSFAGENPVTVYTDYQGIAMTYFTLGPTVGTNIVEASASLSGSPYTFSFESVVGQASIMDAIEGNGGTGVVNTTYGISVKITDVHHNPVQGAHAAYQVLSGGATFQGPSSVITNETGIARVLLRLPTKVGQVVVKTTSNNLPDFYELFTVNVIAGQASTIAEFGGNSQSGTIGQELVFPLEVLITDAFGNSVSGQEVNWVRTQGSGTLKYTPSTTSDDNGIARNYFTIGNQGLNEAWAIASKLNGTPIIFTASGVTNNFPIFDNIGNKSVVEGNSLVFQVHATDADSDPIHYSAENVPQGASFDAGSATFAWTPNNQQSGEYEVTFKASDNRGGFDVEKIIITVKNSNSPPQITAYQPPELEFNVNKENGETINFSVTATDLDNDPLNYRWESNGILVSTSSQYQFNPNPENPGSYIISVVVTDSQDSDSMEWKIDIITSVELAMFEAHFTGHEGVQILWTTTREINNAGFNILRSQSKNGEYTKLNETLITNKTDGKYIYLDKKVQVGHRYYYILEAVDKNGAKSDHGPIYLDVIAPETFQLSQNFPNPFNPETRIRFQLPGASKVVLKIFDVLGREVRTLINEHKEAGFHVVTWDAKDDSGRKVSSGIYYYRIETGEFHQTKKMLLLK